MNRGREGEGKIGGGEFCSVLLPLMGPKEDFHEIPSDRDPFYSVFTVFRNECFCAHPYVKALLEMTPAEIEEFERQVASGDHSNIPGMVRASLGLYNDEGDVDRLLAAIRWIVANRRRLLEEYEVDREGVARRKDGWRVDPKAFDPLPKFT